MICFSHCSQLAAFEKKIPLHKIRLVLKTHLTQKSPTYTSQKSCSWKMCKWRLLNEGTRCNLFLEFLDKNNQDRSMCFFIETSCEQCPQKKVNVNCKGRKKKKGSQFLFQVFLLLPMSTPLHQGPCFELDRPSTGALH